MQHVLVVVFWELCPELMDLFDMIPPTMMPQHVYDIFQIKCQTVRSSSSIVVMYAHWSSWNIINNTALAVATNK